MDKQTIISALRAWIAQRPGLEYGNYGEPRSYNAEMRRIGQDLRQAREMLRAVEWRDSITYDDILAAMRGAYSGRLSWTGARLDYCTGQYWPTEYRAAVCAVLASALWTYTRKNNPGLDGNGLRRKLRAEFGRGIALRWFN